MFEITYDDSHVLQNFIDANKVYHGAIYDFTFEERFMHHTGVSRDPDTKATISIVCWPLNT